VTAASFGSDVLAVEGVRTPESLTECSLPVGSADDQDAAAVVLEAGQEARQQSSPTLDAHSSSYVEAVFKKRWERIEIRNGAHGVIYGVATERTDMSQPDGDESLVQLTTDLARSLRDLERELEPRPPGPRPPTPGELLRFADEIAIPGLILILETNIRALRLLQRAIRLADDSAPAQDQDTPVRDRAVDVSKTTLSRLDDALAELQSAIEGRPENDEARELLAETRSLRDEIDDRLAAEAADSADSPDETTSTEVPVDVDAELQSIKEDIDDSRQDDDDSGPESN
jgi:hypothetical protein